MFPSSTHWDKRDVWELYDGTRKALQVEFKNMLKCTKQKKKVVNATLEQIGLWTCLELTINSHGLYFKQVTTSSFIVYFMIGSGDYIKMVKKIYPEWVPKIRTQCI
jgi:hypothetical protein